MQGEEWGGHTVSHTDVAHAYRANEGVQSFGYPMTTAEAERFVSGHVCARTDDRHTGIQTRRQKHKASGYVHAQETIQMYQHLLGAIGALADYME